MFLPTGTTVNMLTIVNASINHLRKQYISNRFSSTEDDWPPYQPKHYTTLALIHNSGKSPTNAAVISDTQQVRNFQLDLVSQTVENDGKHSKATKNVSDIFASITTTDGSTIVPNMILIEGAPGIGKTVLAKEIAFQWAKNQLLTTKKLFFLIFLRECNMHNLTSTEGFLQYIVKSNEMVGCLTKYLLQTEGKNLVIVLDGYDEMSDEDRRKSFIADIIYRRVFPKCCLVIMSRPTASSHLHNHVDCRVEIVGFAEEDRLDYIKKALQGKDDQVDTLQQCLQSNPTINALCYTPLNMTILLCLTEGGTTTLPKTQTEMYKAFIEITIRRFLRKANEKNVADICCISDLPFPHCEVFKELAQLAFDALQTDTIVFTLAGIRSFCPNLTKESVNWSGLGLLKATQYFDIQANREEVIFQFLHLSIQEYMAAYHISTLPHKKQIALLKKTFWDQHYYNTWTIYVGITGAASFALKHFLSGNTIQLLTKISSTFSISSKLLNNKIKCLHLFHCLEETKNKDAATLVGRFLQDQAVDLSNQTLLPSDVNTLAYFLCRSITKQWKTLNLSKCSIGITGCDFLCKRFLDKDNRDIISVKMVDFSYNQLTFSSLLKLFDLFKSWHTSEVIITDDAILSHTTHNKLFASVEKNFIECKNQNVINLLVVGSFLYINNLEEKRVLNLLSSLAEMKSVYLIQCRWDPNATEVQEWYAALIKQKINKLHIVGNRTSGSFISALVSVISSQHKPINLFIHDPFLSDVIAYGLVDFSLPSESTSDVRLVFSRDKIQGVVITRSLSNEISPLELLNLGACVRSFNHLRMCSWKENMHICSNIGKFALDNLFEYIVYNRTCSCHLQITLVEGNTLFATKATVEGIATVITPNQKLMMFLCDCNLHVSQFKTENIFAHCVSLYIVNSCLSEYTTVLSVTGALIQELFIHGIINISTSDLVRFITNYSDNVSALVVTNGMMIGHNPTAKQIALAFQLEPSITAWKLPNCQVAADVFYQLMDQLTVIPNSWTELDFEGCNITDAECKIAHHYLTIRGAYSTVKTLNISSNRLTIAVTPTLVSIILIWKVQKCFLDGIDKTFYINFIKGLQKALCLTNRPDKISLSVINHSYASCFMYNVNWNEMPILSSHVRDVYIVSCHIPSVEQKKVKFWLKRTNLLKVCVTRSTLCKSFLIVLFKKYRSTNVEVTICDTNVSDGADTIYDLIANKYILHLASMNFLMLTDNNICGFNLTHYQLHLLLHATKQNAYSVVHCLVQIVQRLNSVNQTELFVIHNGHLKTIHFVGKEFHVYHTSHSIVDAMCNNVTTLTRFGIDNYCISDATASGVAAILSWSRNIREVFLNNNKLKASGSAIICRALKKITSLTKLYFSRNTINDEAAHDMAIVLSQNTQIEELDLSNNKMNIPSTAQIITSLTTKHVNLKVLKMANSKVNSVAARLMGDIIGNNYQLQQLDLSGNHLQAFDCAAIFRALLNISALNKLFLSDNYITDLEADVLAMVLSRNTQIQELDISNNKLTTAGATKIAKAMKVLLNLKILKMACSSINLIAAKLIASVLWYSKLQELDLGGNDLQSTGCETVCKALQNISTIKMLNLSNNGITDEAADDIATVLLNNGQLNDIDVKGNYFQANSVAKFAKALRSTSVLNKLYMGNNNISNEAVDDIADILSHNTQMQELELQMGGLSPVNCMKLSNSLHYSSTLQKLIIINSNITSESAGSIAAVLSRNTQLQELNLDGNFLQLEGTRKVLQGLKNTTTLVRLSLRNNHCTSKATDDITHVVSQNTRLQELMLKGNDLEVQDALYIAKAFWKISSSPNTDLENIIGISEML